ncbi:MAG: phage exclusion protein Lit family protein [Dehalococcoidia bacterium]
MLELLWAQSYAYFVFYSKECGGVQPTSQQINPRRTPEVDRALDLLRWASRALVHPVKEPWPIDAPSPATPPSEGSSLHVAQELSLCAVGFILHHEIAHHRFQHQGEHIDSEREADYGAIDWILHDVDVGSPEYRKRILGSTVALLYIIVSGVYTRRHGGDSHPKDYNRLMFTIERYAPSDRDDVWGFVGAILGLYMQDACIRCPPGPFDDHYQCCHALVDELARRDVAL